MLLLKANRIEKAFSDRLIFCIESLKIFRGDKIGLVGLNGAGKTTLLKILSGIEQADQGDVQKYGKQAFIAQEEFMGSDRNRRITDFNQEEHERYKNRYLQELGLDQVAMNTNYLSGGEETRLKIASAFGAKGDLLFADEPTSHLDVEGIQYLQEQCKNFQGALFLVSHDRRFLDRICNKIFELEDGKITEYIGNYSAYKEQKEIQRLTQQQEYENYIKEKKRLSEAIIQRADKAKSIKKAPKRMGNSEARLHKRKAFEKREKIENAHKAIETRLEQLEKKEKPKELPAIQMELNQSLKLYAKYTLKVENLTKSLGKKTLFNGVNFQLQTGSKVALIGPNGCGKSTLIKMILNQEQGIQLAQGIKLGYFSQCLKGLHPQDTILNFVMKNNAYSQELVRTVLARLGFTRDNVFKTIGMLSGGEKVKVNLAKILLGEHNTLILDEPTNFLDLYALEALEELLQLYEGTLLFVTHDRELIDRVATHVLVFQKQNINYFNGTYSQYLVDQQKKQELPKQNIQEQKLRLENRLQQLLGRISLPLPHDDIQELDQEYHQVLRALKHLKNKKNNS